MRVRASQAFEEIGATPTNASDLLNFSVDASGGDSAFATPVGGRTQPLSASSSNWVEEMNAELAEFDALTGGMRPDGGAAPVAGGVQDPAWEERLNAELQAQLGQPARPPG